MPVVLNAGAWTHYSFALCDACAPARRAAGRGAHLRPQAAAEEFRHTSVVEPHAVLTIAGEGIDGYHRALQVIAERR